MRSLILIIISSLIVYKFLIKNLFRCRWSLQPESQFQKGLHAGRCCIGECRRARYDMPLAVMPHKASKTHEAKISRLPPFPRQVATHGRTASSRVWQRERAVLGRQEAPENCSRVLALQRERQSLQQPFCLSRSSVSRAHCHFTAQGCRNPLSSRPPTPAAGFELLAVVT